MTWNWPLIRRISLWIFLSGLVAMIALVVTMIINLPKKCNPPTQWYQGHLLYEICPARFFRSGFQIMPDSNVIPDEVDYLVKLGVRGIRLNSIFNSHDYPYDYEHVTSLKKIAPALGNIEDFRGMIKMLKAQNISVILDLPIYPHIKKLSQQKNPKHKNSTNPSSSDFFRPEEENDLIEDAISFWISHGVEGFYLKDLEKFFGDPYLLTSLQRWKILLGRDRALIVNETLVNLYEGDELHTLLKNIDLVDIRVDFVEGAISVSKQIASIQNSTLFSKPGMPWVHWSLGNSKSPRVANVLHYGNGTLGATLLQLMLPGTPSIFYGDEIGLHNSINSTGKKQDIDHPLQLTVMPWPKVKYAMHSWINDPQFIQAIVVSKMVNLRSESPSIYMNSVYKEGANKATAEVKYAENNLLVIQRWYPRRKAFVVASNMGKKHLSKDLSTLLYSGEIVVGPRVDSKTEDMSFSDISLWPGESVVVALN